MSQREDDALEAAYWTFDTARAGTGRWTGRPQAERDAFKLAVREHVTSAPIPMRLTCPTCNALHIDDGEFATKPHHTHACQGCGAVWRPAIVPTVGVRFLPGFKNEPATPVCSTCNDTRRMKLGDRTVMCTRCPLPCQLCRKGGTGAFCASAPCACSCHSIKGATE